MENISSSLTETTFFILFSLAINPRHGYSIIKEVENLSEGRIKMATGTLYIAIKRLLDFGWIERYQEENEKKDGNRERKYYCLTEVGRQILQAELVRLRKLVKMAGDFKLGEEL